MVLQKIIMKSIASLSSLLPVLFGLLWTFETTNAFLIPSSYSAASGGRRSSYSKRIITPPSVKSASLTASTTTAKFGMKGFELSDVFYDDTSMAFDAW